MCRESKRRPFAQYRDVLTSGQLNYVEYESAAAIIRESLLLPE
jgi:hypothetical protein